KQVNLFPCPVPGICSPVERDGAGDERCCENRPTSGKGRREGTGDESPPGGPSAQGESHGATGRLAPERTPGPAGPASPPANAREPEYPAERSGGHRAPALAPGRAARGPGNAPESPGRPQRVGTAV